MLIKMFEKIQRGGGGGREGGQAVQFFSQQSTISLNQLKVTQG